ncbi:hypothetical protein AAZX31_11G215200 [Glycine max]
MKVLVLNQLRSCKKVACHQLDILDPSSINQFADWLKENYGGLDILLIAVILGHLWCSEQVFTSKYWHPQMRGRIELLLKQNKLSEKHIKDLLQEYHDNIGDLDGPKEKERAQTKIQKFITAL